jgi:hypothetical protein
LLIAEYKIEARKRKKIREEKKKRGRGEFPVFAGLWYPANNICIS